MHLADRLLSASDTQTGIPFGAVHLLTSVQAGEITAASIAGGGFLTPEFEP